MSLQLENNRNRTAATVSAVLTVTVLILLAAVLALLQMAAVNGASEKQGLTAMGVSITCQGIVILLLALFAARATAFLITKVKWDSILAVATTVIAASLIGGTISFLLMIISIPLAGIR